jgi:hypothetical protein
MSVKDTLKRLLGLGLSIDDATELVATGSASAQAEAPSETAREPATPVRRGRLGNGPRVAYVLTDKAKRHMKDRAWDPTSVMFNTQAQTFAAIAKRRQPTTARELEGLTGLVRKTIESTVYHLRNDGWIESVAINGHGTDSTPESVVDDTTAETTNGRDTDRAALIADIVAAIKAEGKPKRKGRRSVARKGGKR